MPTAISDTLWIQYGALDFKGVAESLKARLLSESDPIDVVINELLGSTAEIIKNNKPTALLWIGGPLDVPTVSKCLKSSMPVGIAHVGLDQTPQPQVRKMFRPVKIDKISFAMATDRFTAATLNKYGVPPERIKIAEQLMADPEVLPYFEDERRAIADLLGTRPNWLAAGARRKDIPMLIEAQKYASRAAHRLLLSVVPADPSEDLAQAFRDAGLNVAEHGKGDDLHDAAEVFLGESLDDLGLFLRIATMTFICGTFDGKVALDPTAAAALGCAIISGPKLAPYETPFKRLAENGALRPVFDQKELGEAIISLLSVERTARLAHAGWNAATEGIESLDKLEQLTRTHLLRFEA